MTLAPQAETRIDDRIRTLAPRRVSASARQELRSHVSDAAEDLARGGAAQVEHVDAAFAALGSDADIRATFFPARAHAPVGRGQVALLVLATLLAASAILADGAGKVSCSVRGEGSCEASASGHAVDLALWASPPLLVLGALLLRPKWPAVVMSATYLLLAGMRTVDTANLAGASSSAALLPVAALLAFIVAGRQAMLDRRLGRDANA